MIHFIVFFFIIIILTIYTKYTKYNTDFFETSESSSVLGKGPIGKKGESVNCDNQVLRKIQSSSDLLDSVINDKRFDIIKTILEQINENLQLP